jgi:hypothetical protein
MANIRLCSYNLVDIATNTGTTAAAGYPASNLALPTREDRFRTTDAASGREILGTLAANGRANFVALWRHNLTASATWRVRLWSNANWTGGPLYDSGTVTAFDSALLDSLAVAEGLSAENVLGLKMSVLYFSLQTTVRSWTVTLNDTTNPAGYIEAPRLWVGEYLTPTTTNIAKGVSMAWDEETDQVRAASGTLRSISRVGPFRRFRFALPLFEAADRKILSGIARHAGRRRDCFLSLYPGDGTALELENQALVKFDAAGELEHRLTAHWNTSLSAAEL